MLNIFSRIVKEKLLNLGRFLNIYVYGIKHKNQINQLHGISRPQRGRQREPNVKTLRSPLSAEFWRHCLLNGRIQLRALSRHQSEEMEI